MAAITWPQVVDFDASLSAVPVNAQNAILAYVNEFVNVNLFDGEAGVDTKLARIYLAAHHGLGAVPGTSGGGGGAITSESGGDGLSVTYAVAATASTDGALAETAWGRRWLAMAKTSCAGGILL